MANEFLLAEFSNLVASVTGQPTVLEIGQMSGDPTLGDALVASTGRMPLDVSQNVLRSRAGTGNPILDAQNYLNGALYQVGLYPPDDEGGITGIAGGLYQAGIDAIDYTISNPAQVISDLNWPGTGIQIINKTFDVFGQHIPVLGAALANMSTQQRDVIVADVLAGNFGGLAADAITGALIPWLAAQAIGLLARQFGYNFGYRPPQPQLTEYYWPDDLGPIFTRTPPTAAVNVGHKGHMSVKLGNIPFELPPATISVLPLNGAVQGQQAPGAEAGIRFEHVNNWAELLIPGGAPIYQGLGLKGLYVEFVGAFLGFDNNRLLNQDFHKVGFHDPYNPDPLYTDPDRKGGAWAVSRVFLDNAVAKEEPVDFEIFSGVVRIKYKVIIKSYTRWYRDDARVYYKFSCAAIGGVEGGTDTGTTLVQRATKSSIKGKQTPVKGSGKANLSTAAGVLGKPSVPGKAGVPTVNGAPLTTGSKPVSLSPAALNSAVSKVTRAEVVVSKAESDFNSLAIAVPQTNVTMGTLNKLPIANQAAMNQVMASATKGIGDARAAVETLNSQTIGLDKVISGPVLDRLGNLMQRLDASSARMTTLRGKIIAAGG